MFSFYKLNVLCFMLCLYIFKFCSFRLYFIVLSMCLYILLSPSVMDYSYIVGTEKTIKYYYYY